MQFSEEEIASADDAAQAAVTLADAIADQVPPPPIYWWDSPQTLPA